MKSTKYESGFTLVELLVALVVTSIVLTAVATLAFAMGRANDSSLDTSERQAQVRYATVRISELIRHCRLICRSSSEDFAVWRADDNGDGQININELVYIERGPGQNRFRLCEFPSSDSSVISLGSIQALSSNWWSAYSSSIDYTSLVPGCSNVEFAFDVPPPNTGFVNVSFDVLENGVAHRYQTNAALRGRAGYLLDSSGQVVGSDDD